MAFILISIPETSLAEGINNMNDIFLVAQQKTIINYEKSQPSSIDNPVVDPNFNVMRAEDTASSTATYIVIGLLIAATIIPLATWWYFSNKFPMVTKNIINRNKSSNIIFITGGTKSGKSEFAEHLAKNSSQLTYIALSEKRSGDENWEKKISIHRKRRPKSWKSIETSDLGHIKKKIGPIY